MTWAILERQLSKHHQVTWPLEIRIAEQGGVVRGDPCIGLVGFAPDGKVRGVGQKAPRGGMAVNGPTNRAHPFGALLVGQASGMGANAYRQRSQARHHGGAGG